MNETPDHITPKGHSVPETLGERTRKIVHKEKIEKFVIVKDGKFLGDYGEFFTSVLDARLLNKEDSEFIRGDGEEIKTLHSVHYVLS
jgi:protein required for attachment to host cells